MQMASINLSRQCQNNPCGPHVHARALTSYLQQRQIIKELETIHDARANIRKIVVDAGGPDDGSVTLLVKFPHTIKLKGNSAVVEKIIATIEDFVKQREDQVTLSLQVPQSQHRVLIGRGGETRRGLESHFYIALDVPREGSSNAVENAQAHILSHLKEQQGETVEVPRHLHHTITQNGASSGDDESSFEDRMAAPAPGPGSQHSSLSEELSKSGDSMPERNRKMASFKEVESRTIHHVDSAHEDEDAIETENEEVSESAIEDDDDDSEWQDSVEGSVRSSVDEKDLFQRVDSRPNLVSRRSLLTRLVSLDNHIAFSCASLYLGASFLGCGKLSSRGQGFCAQSSTAVQY
ncbi:Protein of unknown function (DUF3295) domain containing protein [Elaphomyces granulatus]